MGNVGHKEYMKIAINEAIKGINKKHGGPFGAVIVSKGRVLSKAHNTVVRDSDPTKHAEINAISKAARKYGIKALTKATIYSTVEPCPMCTAAIHWARIPYIVYGADINTAKKHGYNEILLPAKKLMKAKGMNIKRIIGGVLKEECEEVFKMLERDDKGKKLRY